jgi:hypothetical protein
MTPMILLHPLASCQMELGVPVTDLKYPPDGWRYIQDWGLGHAFAHTNGLRVLIDASQKEDDRWWVHVSVSRKSWTPTHEDMCMVKRDFLGDRYAYAVYPPQEQYVNIHAHCLHLWSLAEGDGRVLPEFSGEISGIKSI